MTTHYHLVVECTTAELSRAIQWLNTPYARVQRPERTLSAPFLPTGSQSGRSARTTSRARSPTCWRIPSPPASATGPGRTGPSVRHVCRRQKSCSDECLTVDRLERREVLVEVLAVLRVGDRVTRLPRLGLPLGRFVRPRHRVRTREGFVRIREIPVADPVRLAHLETPPSVPDRGLAAAE